MASSCNPKRMKTAIGNPSKGQKQKERIYSHYFLKKDNDDRFQVVMQRKFVTETKVILKPGEVNEFQLELIKGGWERLGNYPSTFSVTLVKEFYTNAKVTTSATPTFLSCVCGGKGCPLMLTRSMTFWAPSWLMMWSASCAYFSYFQKFCSVAPKPRRCHQPQPKPEPELELEATSTIDMRL